MLTARFSMSLHIIQMCSSGVSVKQTIFCVSEGAVVRGAVDREPHGVAGLDPMADQHVEQVVTGRLGARISCEMDEEGAEVVAAVEETP